MKSTSVATGDSHTCASLPDNTVNCWGDNTYGQLGTDWVLPRAFSPLAVSGVTAATAVTGGGTYTCALLKNGKVSCWGSNISGQLGDGTTNDSFTPVAVSGVSTATTITASHGRMDSYGHTCALLSDHTVKCWGRNIVGQLGTGDTTDSYTPISVTGLSGVVAVQAGGFHNCAIITGGTVQCWGDNALGQVGDGTLATLHTTPFTVLGISNATALALGGDFSCALLSGGTVKCWGGNGQGRLGDGLLLQSLSTPDISPPVTVVGITNAIAISAGRGHACAVLSNHTIQCWGDNSAGMLGNGMFTNSSTPVTVTGISNAIGITGGAVHTCARLADSTVQCWGDNANAQIGPGSKTNSTTPASVLSASTQLPIAIVSTVATGSLHGCGLLNNGNVGCWGNNGLGQLGSNLFARSSAANIVSVSGVPITVSVSGVPITPLPITQPTALTAGGWHTCAIMQADGSIGCWGDNAYGQLGDGTLTKSSTPVMVNGIVNGTTTYLNNATFSYLPIISTTTAVAAGSVRSCAIISQKTDTGLCVVGGACPSYSYTNTVKCWGDNDHGQLGDGTTNSSSTPVNVSAITTASAITGGYNHTCALISGGGIQFNTVQCWGANYSGQLGNGTTTDSPVPVTVSGIGGFHLCPGGGGCAQPPHVVALGVGNMNDHSCAVMLGGTVMCWGDNTFGQLGVDPLTMTNSSTPVPVTGITNATAVALGYGHTCALLSDNTVKCWGWNILGQLGNGTATDSSVPVTVSGLTDATTITAGFTQTCAARSSGGIQCWGDNSYAQLGLGVTATSSPTPMGISVVTRTKAGGHSYPSCVLSLLTNTPTVCVLGGNLIVSAGTFILVLPLPPQ
jgi:alpha-tubulin suppressor-like RCC1 family protein